MVIIRTVQALVQQNDYQRAVALADKFFEGFPHFNFPYDASIVPLISAYVQTESFDRAKTHLRILANETADWLEFFDSIDPYVLESSFANDYALRRRALNSTNSLINMIPEPEFQEEIKGIITPYQSTQVPN